MESEIVVRTQALAKRFGPVEALRGVDLEIQAGETYGLLGPNGSGKTTLIRLIAGLLAPSAGRAYVLGQAMPNKGVLAQVGYMTQSGALYSDLTVRENIAFFATLYGSAIRSRVAEVIELVDLTERADSLVGTLSGGMRQRVSLACALAHGPRLLLLDEPTVGIDPQLRVVFWDYFRQLNSQGVTIVVSSHVMDEAERCHRLGMFREGRLLAEGSPDEIKTQAGTANLEQAFLHFASGLSPGRAA